MKFEWDSKKAATNLKKHGVSFDSVTSAFEDELSATFPDPDHSISEARLITYGVGIDGKLLVIAHAELDDTIRIISARFATTHERTRYES
ncbi:MAG: BrnT family toxin [Gallionella sp.]|nr:BrnT family toxin [Gallionella sp.]